MSISLVATLPDGRVVHCDNLSANITVGDVKEEIVKAGGLQVHAWEISIEHDGEPLSLDFIPFRACCKTSKLPISITVRPVAIAAEPQGLPLTASSEILFESGDRLKRLSLSRSAVELKSISSSSVPTSASWKYTPQSDNPLIKKVFDANLDLETGDVTISPDIKKSLKLEFEVSTETNTLLAFKKRNHENFGGFIDEIGPVIITIMHAPDLGETVILVRTSSGSNLHRIQNTLLQWDKAHVQSLLRAAVHYSLDFSKLTKIQSNELSTKLFEYDDSMSISFFKFGILLATQGQDKEAHWYANENATPEFIEFLSLLGPTIKMKDWQGYRGGLDNSPTSNDSAIYCDYQGIKIMFHVSTLLPHCHGDPQQLAKKKHIGNDVVVIIFKQGDTPLDLTSVCSQFNHIFIVVSPDKQRDGYYKVNVARKRGVPLFNPLLGLPPCVPKDLIREFIFKKAMNGERAAYHCNVFEEKWIRTRNECLRRMLKEYCK